MTISVCVLCVVIEHSFVVGVHCHASACVFERQYATEQLFLALPCRASASVAASFARPTVPATVVLLACDSGFFCASPLLALHSIHFTASSGFSCLFCSLSLFNKCPT